MELRRASCYLEMNHADLPTVGTGIPVLHARLPSVFRPDLTPDSWPLIPIVPRQRRAERDSLEMVRSIPRLLPTFRKILIRMTRLKSVRQAEPDPAPLRLLNLDHFG